MGLLHAQLSVSFIASFRCDYMKHMALGPRVLHKLGALVEYFLRHLFKHAIPPNRRLGTLSLSLGVSGAPASESESTLVKRADPVESTFPTGRELSTGPRSSPRVQFAYIKATEGTTYIDPYFDHNYVGATNNGIIRGATTLHTQAAPAARRRQTTSLPTEVDGLATGSLSLSSRP
ncbi:hypothetical protein EDB84DRAFT_515506 [Lactarius hengduanensis]|nr:hypothetical protein EDB84DRAFT_515506 [Lactarius hengduanensis]